MGVTGALLYGGVDKKVYLKPSKGINIKQGYVLILTKSLHRFKKSPKYSFMKYLQNLVIHVPKTIVFYILVEILGQF